MPQREGGGGGRLSLSFSSAMGDHDEELVRPEWALDQIELSDSDSELEFFDAKGKMVLQVVVGGAVV